MKLPRNSRLVPALGLTLLAGAATLALPALGQGPESILPPGFGDPAPPPPRPAPSGAPAQPGAAPAPLAVPDGETGPIVAVEAPPPPTPEELAAAEEAKAADELPPEARRPVEGVGTLAQARGGFAGDAFGRADGRFLTGLMRRLDAPVASRWAAMLLRRALLSPVATPRGVEPADWVAERAALLLRMGEADGARMLVQAVDPDRYSRRLYAVALQTAQATSDPTALCGIADRGAATSKASEWQLARAICAGLAGDSATSGEILDKARADRTAGGVDLLLAEKLAAAGTNDRRAISISWASTRTLTPWRFGMGNAAFVPIPPALIASGGPAMVAWAARTPALPASARIDPARTAAVMGVFSSAVLVDLYSTLGDDSDPDAEDDSPTGRLRLAYAASDPSARIAALRKLWADPPSAQDRYANYILTALAAARIDPIADFAGDLSDAIPAMLAAGYDRRAAQWAQLVPSGSDGDRAWSLLAVATPTVTVPYDADRAARLDQRHRLLLEAGLAGLGRMPQGTPVPSGADAWTRALYRAVAADQPATVALLAAVGLQSAEWNGIDASRLFHIVRALSATGHQAEARMIAAEALARSV